LKDLKSFPSEVKAEVGHALYAAQPRRHRPRGQATEGFRRRQRNGDRRAIRCNTWRAVYTVRFRGFVYVLHAFQKKSKSGIATPKKDIDLIHQRLAAAERDYRERQNEHDHQEKTR
jgi:phage-related protein